MKKGILILLSFCSFAGLCYGQNRKIDSMLQVLKIAKDDTAKVNTFIALASEFASNNPDTAVYFANKAFGIATKIKYKMGIAFAHNLMGLGLYYLSKYEEALKNYNDALKLYDDLLTSAKTTFKSRILKGKGDAYNNIGHIFRIQGNYPEALKNYFNAMRIYQEIGDKEGIAKASLNTGIIYNEQGNNEEALKNYFVALKICEELGHKKGKALTLSCIGVVYNNKGNNPEALKNYFAALKICEELGDLGLKANNLNNIGNVYYQQGNYPGSLRNHLAVLKITKEIMDKVQMANCFNALARDYRKLNKTSEAYRYVNKGLSLAKEIGKISVIRDSYDLLVTLDSAQGNFNQAFEHHKMYITYRDSIINKENTKKIMEIQMQYEFDKKESLEKAEQEKKDAITLKELQRQKLLRNFFIGMIGLGFVLFFLMYRAYRARQMLRLNDIRNKIAGDLHDDIGSTLNSISIYSEVAKKKGEYYDEALEMIGDASRKVIEAMSDIVWTINSENDSFEKIIFRMTSHAYNLFRARKIEFTFQADETLNEKKLSIEERRNFFLIFKEALNNLVKYSNATHASITLTYENNQIKLLIRDDGVGFDTSKENAGNGLKNMKRRANEMKAEFKIESQIDSGTQLDLILKA